MPAAYRIEHLTRYAYATTVAASQHVACLRPRELAWQHVREYRLEITPPAAHATRRIDYYGNAADHFQILTPHQDLAVAAFSVVEVADRAAPDAAASPPAHAHRAASPPPDVAVFAYGSPHAPVLPDTVAFAGPSFPPGQTVLGGAIDLMHRIYGSFTFDPDATSVANPVTEVLATRRGVCQDFAHLHVSALRSMGVAARYVSGYLLTDPPPGQPRLIGADASHAWVAVHCPAHGWIELDPTNDVIVGTRHVTLAWGRDYGDVSPLRGVLMGGTRHTLTVGVSVIPA